MRKTLLATALALTASATAAQADAPLSPQGASPQDVIEELKQILPPAEVDALTKMMTAYEAHAASPIREPAGTRFFQPAVGSAAPLAPDLTHETCDDQFAQTSALATALAQGMDPSAPDNLKEIIASIDAAVSDCLAHLQPLMQGGARIGPGGMPPEVANALLAVLGTSPSGQLMDVENLNALMATLGQIKAPEPSRQRPTRLRMNGMSGSLVQISPREHQEQRAPRRLRGLTAQD
ncbi:MAG: hypothetical protein AAF744_13045 [Pseudomonadota bacterium]